MYGTKCAPWAMVIRRVGTEPCRGAITAGVEVTRPAGSRPAEALAVPPAMYDGGPPLCCAGLSSPPPRLSTGLAPRRASPLCRVLSHARQLLMASGHVSTFFLFCTAVLARKDWARTATMMLLARVGGHSVSFCVVMGGTGACVLFVWK